MPWLIFFMSLIASPLYAADQPVKVYSAHELQKMSDRVFNSLNANQVDEGSPDLLNQKTTATAPQTISKSLRQIEKAFAADTQDELRQIYNSAVAAKTGNVPQTLPTAASASAPATPKVPSQNTSSEATAVAPIKRTPNNRLDAWFQRHNDSEPSQP